MTWFRRSALGEWLDAADPGALRLHHAARTALASLTAWVIIHFVLLGLAKRPMPSGSLFAVTVCFIDALVIVDARRAERRTTLLLSLAMFGLALVLASLLHATGWLYPVALLALIFGSYAARRRGLRPGELVLLLTMGLYFAQGSRVTWANLAWFALATLIGVASLWLWQFVLLPYDPTKSLRASLQAFYRRAASLADAVAVGLEDPAKATSDNDLSRSLKQVKLSRRVIESQFPGVLTPGGWTEAEIGQMKLALYATEQGLAQMVEGASKQELLDDIPAEVRVPLVQSMRSMQEALSTGSVESFQALAADGASLQTQVRAYARSVTGEDRSQPDTPLALWVGTVLRLVRPVIAIRLDRAGDGGRRTLPGQGSAGRARESLAGRWADVFIDGGHHLLRAYRPAVAIAGRRDEWLGYCQIADYDYAYSHRARPDVSVALAFCR